MKKIQNSAGFTVIEALLVLVIVSMVGFTGWYVRHTQKTADKTLTSNTSTTPVFKKKDAAPKTATPTATPTPPTTTAKATPTKPLTPTNGIVTSADGKVQVTLPAGWVVDSRVDGGSNCGFAPSVSAPGTCITDVSFTQGGSGYVKMYQTTSSALDWYKAIFGACSSPENSTVNGNAELICVTHLNNSKVYTISNGSYLAYFAGDNSTGFLNIVNSTKFL